MYSLPRGKNRSPACTIYEPVRPCFFLSRPESDSGAGADRGLDFQGDRFREGFKVRRASSSIASWVGFRLHGFSINRSEFTLRAALTDVLIVHVTGVVQFVAH